MFLNAKQKKKGSEHVCSRHAGRVTNHFLLRTEEHYRLWMERFGFLSSLSSLFLIKNTSVLVKIAKIVSIDLERMK